MNKKDIDEDDLRDCINDYCDGSYNEWLSWNIDDCMKHFINDNFKKEFEDYCREVFEEFKDD